MEKFLNNILECDDCDCDCDDDDCVCDDIITLAAITILDD